MFEDMGAFWYIVLFVASVFGGFVGSLSGGAGMITMPPAFVEWAKSPSSPSDKQASSLCGFIHRGGSLL